MSPFKLQGEHGDGRALELMPRFDGPPVHLETSGLDPSPNLGAARFRDDFAQDRISADTLPATGELNLQTAAAPDLQISQTHLRDFITGNRLSGSVFLFQTPVPGMIPRAFIDVEAVNILAVGIPPDFARIREDSRFATTVTIAFATAGIALRRRMINSINQLPPPLFEKGRNVQPCEKTGRGSGVKAARKPHNS